MTDRLPILILAGSDQRRSTVPAGLESRDMLCGYKGTIPLKSGRPLVQELVHRIVESGRFQTPILVGPERVFGMLMRGVGILAAADLRNLLSCQLPVLTFTVPYSCLRAYGNYRRRRATIADFQTALATSFVHRRFRRRVSNRPLVFSLTRTVSFAKDIDTKAELDEASG